MRSIRLHDVLYGSADWLMLTCNVQPPSVRGLMPSTAAQLAEVEHAHDAAAAHTALLITRRRPPPLLCRNVPLRVSRLRAACQSAPLGTVRSTAAVRAALQLCSPSQMERRSLCCHLISQPICSRLQPPRGMAGSCTASRKLCGRDLAVSLVRTCMSSICDACQAENLLRRGCASPLR